jgi:predicted DCC family thiol-disulfide oxidoreductase YuxK
MPQERPDDAGLVIIYDGQCPFCSAYVRMLRLRDAAGPVRLVDARGDDPSVRAAREAGSDLDAGMVVTYGGTIRHGDEAMHLLALLGTPSGHVNRMLARAFRSARVARLLYPVLAAGRRATLALLGRERINGSALLHGVRKERF